ncbi:MAG: PCRF domain-containing protein [Phreatobacter sp.]|uniref:PCRF domain-containing protein n=1 Tax=Phreatobacter sp. TaxID=1966341 RepID=UPI002732407D|nr:PCRF domain-containing protein [Phreatobacter sp.]MDP2800724.1 PCRF domain-containing protein [Phreatobacter sp.]
MFDDAADQPVSCYIDIVALAGADEGHAFVDMMLNMYRLWAYNHHLHFQVVFPRKLVERGGIDRAKLRIDGADPDMLASRENGVHRMIRTPPGKTQRRMALIGVRVCDAADAPLPEAPYGWGEQIRSLIVDPHPCVKNHCTGFECQDTVGVIAGDLDQFWEERT